MSYYDNEPRRRAPEPKPLSSLSRSDKVRRILGTAKDCEKDQLVDRFWKADLAIRSVILKHGDDLSSLPKDDTFFHIFEFSYFRNNDLGTILAKIPSESNKELYEILHNVAWRGPKIESGQHEWKQLGIDRNIISLLCIMKDQEMARAIAFYHTFDEPSPQDLGIYADDIWYDPRKYTAPVSVVVTDVNDESCSASIKVNFLNQETASGEGQKLVSTLTATLEKFNFPVDKLGANKVYELVDGNTAPLRWIIKYNEDFSTIQKEIEEYKEYQEPEDLRDRKHPRIMIQDSGDSEDSEEKVRMDSEEEEEEEDSEA